MHYIIPLLTYFYGVTNNTTTAAYLCICKEEDRVLVVDPGEVIQLLQVIVEGGVVVAATQLDLETPVPADVGTQSNTDR